MILVNLAGSRGDVLLDEMTLANSLEDELLDVLVQPLVDVVNVVQTEKISCFKILLL